MEDEITKACRRDRIKEGISDLIWGIGMCATIGGGCLYGLHKLDESAKEDYKAAIEARQMPEGCNTLIEQRIQLIKPLLELKCRDADGRTVFYYEDRYPGRWKKAYGMQD